MDDGAVYVCWRCHPFLHHATSLRHEQGLQPGNDVARRGGAPDRRLAQGLEQGHHLLRDLLIGVRPGTHLHQGDEMGGVEKMRVQKTAWTDNQLLQLRHQHGGGGGGDNGVRLAVAVNPFEGLFFGGARFRHGLDDKVRLFQGLAGPGPALDGDELNRFLDLPAAEQAATSEKLQVRLELGPGRGPKRLNASLVPVLDVQQRHRTPGVGEHEGQSPAHAPRARHRKPLQFHRGARGGPASFSDAIPQQGRQGLPV